MNEPSSNKISQRLAEAEIGALRQTTEPLRAAIAKYWLAVEGASHIKNKEDLKEINDYTNIIAQKNALSESLQKMEPQQAKKALNDLKAQCKLPTDTCRVDRTIEARYEFLREVMFDDLDKQVEQAIKSDLVTIEKPKPDANPEKEAMKNKPELCQSGTHDIFVNPVITLSGETHERSVIEPLTKDPLIPNRAIKEIIDNNGYYYPICPITLDIMKDPVVAMPSGHTYERTAIENLKIDPQTREPITGLIPNHALKSYMDNPLLPTSETLAKLLPEKKIDIEITMNLAAKAGRLDIIEDIYNYAQSKNILITIEMIGAAKDLAEKSGHSNIVEYLATKLPPKDVWATRNEQITPKIELEKHLDEKNYPEALALLKKHRYLVNTKLNLKENINDSADNNTPLKALIIAGEVEGVKELLTLGAEVKTGDTLKYNALSTLITVLYNNPHLIENDNDKEKYGNIIAELLKKDPDLIQPHEIKDIKKLGLDKRDDFKAELKKIAPKVQLEDLIKNKSQIKNDSDKIKWGNILAELIKEDSSLIQPQEIIEIKKLGLDKSEKLMAELLKKDPKKQLEAHINNKDYPAALSLLQKNPDLVNTELDLEEDIIGLSKHNTPLNVFIMAKQVNGVQELLKLGAQVIRRHGGHSLDSNSLSTMLFALEKSPPASDQDKIAYGDIVAEIVKGKKDLLEIYIKEIEKLDLTKSDTLRPIVSQVKYEKEIGKIDAAIANLEGEIEKESLKKGDKDYTLKSTKIDALKGIRKAMEDGGDVTKAIAKAKGSDTVKQGWTTGSVLGKSRTEELLDKLEQKVTKKNKDNENPDQSPRRPGR